MLTQDIQRAERVWPEVASILFVPRTERDYKRLVAVLDKLIDTVGEDESHPLASLMDVIGALVEGYEDKHVPEIVEA
jgi:HTH-type transcriptional regulator/antitoxin HigA